MKAADRIGNSKAVRILFAIMLIVGLAPTVTLAQAGSAQAVSGDGYLTVGGSVPYAGYSTNWMDVDGNMAYCGNPSKATPGSGWYSKADVSAFVPENNYAVWNALYFGYGGPGFDAAVAAGVYPSQWYDGSGMDDGKYLALTHIILSGIYANDIPAAIYGTDYLFQQWCYDSILYGGTHYDSVEWKLIQFGGQQGFWGIGAFQEAGFEAYQLYTGSGTQYILSFEYNPAGWMELDKDSSNPGITDGNSAYSLAGAKYGIYSSRDDANARRNPVQTMTTNGDGWARSGDLTPGTYYVRESNAEGEHGEGFAVDEQIYEVVVESGETAYVNGGKVYDKPQNDPAYMWVGKIDLETTQNMPQGSASLAGAQFTIRYYDGQYASAAAAEASGAPTRTWVVKTDDDGFAQLDSDYKISGDNLYTTSEGRVTIPLGTLLIQETKAPEGYVLPDPATVFVRNVTAEGVVESVTTFNAPTQPEEVARGGVVIEKVDVETGGESVNGSDLSGAVFRIVNESDNAVQIDGKTVQPGGKVADIVTDEDGIAATATDLLPYGDYSVTEITAPEGYFGTDKTIEFSITSDGEVKRFEGTDGFANQSLRGDLEFQKKKEGDGTALAHIPFRLTNNATGESHILVTDANGYASTSAEWNKHTSDTNANDDAAEDAYSDTAGIWFGVDAGAAPDDSLGALPYGTYTLEELPCKANEGLQLVLQENISITRDGVTVDLGTIDDPDKGEVYIGTSASDAADGDKTVAMGQNAKVVDRVFYMGLTPGETYTLSSSMVVTEGGEALDFGEGQISATMEFTPDSANGTVDVVLDLGSTVEALAEGAVEIKGTVYEELYKDGRLVAEHKELKDSGQIVRIVPPEASTKASDAADGDRIVASDPDSKLHDEVAYSYLEPRAEYRLLSAAVPRELASGVTPDDLGDALGTADVTFTASREGEGTVGSDVYCDTTGLEDGQAIVMMAWIFDNAGNLVASHADPNAASQTLTVRTPSIGTTASDPVDGDQTVIDDGSRQVTLVDIVSYENLVPGKAYRLVGTLMDAQTGLALEDPEGNPVTATADFTPALSAGTAEVSFTFDASSIPTGGSVVVFEDLYREDAKIASHADIDDEGQTVTVDRPSMWTDASDPADGDQLIVIDPEAAIHDQVSVEDVVDGKDYRLIGIIMDKATGLPFVQDEVEGLESWWNDVKDALGADEDGWADAMPRDVDLTALDELMQTEVGQQVVAASTDFRLHDSWGQVGVDFGPFDATSLSPHDELVAFEALINVEGSCMIASHADLGDYGQTVTVTTPQLDSVAVDSSDGDKALAEDPEASVTETLSVSNAVPEVEYSVKAQLRIVGDDGSSEPLGDPVEKRFTLDHDHGEVTVEIPCDISTAAGKKVVVTDELYREGVKIAEHSDLADADQTVEVYEPEIGTSASDPVDGDQTVVIDPETTIVDVVSYHGLVPGKTYTVELVPHVKSTGDPLVDPETGEIYSSVLEFTPDKPDGEVEVSVTVDTSALSGDSIVAFETLYRNGIEIAAHADIDDEGQTVEVVQPEVDTVAVDGLDGDKTVVADPDAAVKDTLSYGNAIPETGYTSHGILMDAETGLPLLSGEGAEEIDSSELEAFWQELLSLLNIQQPAIEPDGPLDGGAAIEGEPPAGHEDEAWDGIVDSSAVGPIASLLDQLYPDEAQDGADEADQPEAREMPFVASVADWEGIYKLFADNPEIAQCVSTSEVEFIADRASGEVTADFDVDAKDLAGKKAVVFQVLTKPDSEGVEWSVALHADLRDADQTVEIVPSEIGTEATDKSDGDHTILNSSTATIVDEVSYENLIPGREYELKGVLMDKATGEPLIVNDKQVTAEMRFTPNQPSGSVEMEFTFDASALEGAEIVVFEDLYKDGIEVASHADIEDASQTVKVEAPPIGDTYGQTGRDIAVVGAIVAALAVVGGGVAAYAIRRRRMAGGPADDRDAS